MIWKHALKLEGMNAMGNNSMPGFLEIEFTEFGEDYLIARMPVNEKTRQPFGLLHGGASGVLAETLGSVASYLCLDDPTRQAAVGIELNCSHLRSAKDGFVYGKVTPYRIGRKIQVWNIEIQDEQHKLICVSRLTIAVVDRS